jgi:type I restriction enzyme R subunit
MKLFGNYDEADVKGTLIDVSDKIKELEQSYSRVHDIFKSVKGSSDDEVYVQLLKDEPNREVFYKSLSALIRNFNECFVLQNFVHEFKHLDVYKRELKKFMDLRKTVSLRYADRVDLSEYRQSLVHILDKYVDARGVELLTKQINITDRKQFEEAIETLGTDKSKAEAIAAQTRKTISEKMDSDPEFYERFSKKISEILQKMREEKMADVEALKQLRLIGDDLVNKKDESLPAVIAAQKGSDVLYRNLKESFTGFDLSDDTFIPIVLGIFGILKREAIVDWYKNVDVKRQMTNAVDD